MQPNNSQKMVKLPALRGNIGEYHIHKHIDLDYSNGLYQVYKRDQENQVNRKMYMLKFYSNLIGFQRELDVFSHVYNLRQDMQGFFVSSGNTMSEDNHKVIYTVTAFQNNGNLIDFIRPYIPKKKEQLCMSEKCSKHLIHSILLSLKDVQTKKSILHHRLNLDNILLSEQKNAIVIGWSTHSPTKTISDIIYDVAQVYCTLLTGGPIYKKNTAKKNIRHLEPQQWKDFVKIMENKKNTIISQSGPSSFQKIMDFLKTTITTEAQNSDLTFQRVLELPFFQQKPSVNAMKQEITDLIQNYQLKSEQKIAKEFQRKIDRQMLKRKSEEEAQERLKGLRSQKSRGSEQINTLIQVYTETEQKFWEIQEEFMELQVKQNKKQMEKSEIQQYKKQMGKPEIQQNSKMAQQYQEFSGSPPLFGKKKSSVLIGNINEVSYCIASLDKTLSSWKKQNSFLTNLMFFETSLNVTKVCRSGIELQIILILADEENETYPIKLNVSLHYIFKNHSYYITSSHLQIVESYVHQFYDQMIKKMIDEELSIFITSPASTTA